MTRLLQHLLLFVVLLTAYDAQAQLVVGASASEILRTLHERKIEVDSSYSDNHRKTYLSKTEMFGHRGLLSVEMGFNDRAIAIRFYIEESLSSKDINRIISTMSEAMKSGPTEHHIPPNIYSYFWEEPDVVTFVVVADALTNITSMTRQEYNNPPSP